MIIRGIERKAIFKDAKDYRNFLDRLGLILTETEKPCFAWALMSNHAHLPLRTGLVPLSLVMRRLLTGYAQQFNRRHRRHGHVFQNRYNLTSTQKSLKAQASKETALGQGQLSAIWQWKNWEWLARSLLVN